MILLLSSFIRGAPGSSRVGVALNPLQKGILKGRGVSTQTTAAKESVGVSHEAGVQQPLASTLQPQVIEKVTQYVEKNAHKLGGWYYAGSIGGGVLSILSGVVIVCYRALDKQINAVDKRISGVDKRIDDLAKQTKKDISELKAEQKAEFGEIKADIREIRMFMMQQARHPIYSPPPKDNT